MKGRDMNKIVPIESTEEMPCDCKNTMHHCTLGNNCRVIKAASELDHIIVSKAEHEQMKADAERWKYFACNQTALMLGSKLDPNDKSINWLEECNKLADEVIYKARRVKCLTNY
jgi:hypothetical protein